MLILFKLKEAVEKIPETIKEINQSTTTLLGFVGIMICILVSGIVGIASFSKMPLWCNLAIIGALLILIVYMLLRTFNSAIKNPQRFIFNQNAFITIMREKLTDSESGMVYYSDQLTDQNMQAQKQISEQSQKKGIE